jgi:acylpyruvate hydrolase
MRFASYIYDGTERVGVLEGGHLIPLDGLSELGRDTPAHVLRDATRLEAERVPVADVRLRPVVPRPDKIVCVGLNYHSHVDETKRELPTYPVLFTKFASSLIGARDPIQRPPESTQVDYEAELAVIVGSVVRRASREQAAAAVLGHCVANDITMRDYQYKTHQWLQGKAWDGSTPLGPYLVTPDEVDAGDLRIRLTLNGQELQSSSTSRLMFDVPTLISTISEFTTLLPGDVILTGTPGGVGYRRDPQVFLQDGDVVSVEIDGVGELENAVVAEQAVPPIG